MIGCDKMNAFQKALMENDRELLKKIDKVDIHNHAVTSCTKEYLRDHGIELSNEKIVDIQSLIQFSRSNLTPIQQTEEGLRLLLEGNFDNCIKTGIKYVSSEIDYKSCIRTFNSDIKRYIDFLKSFKYENLTISWDLGISRDSFQEEHRELIIKLLETGFYSGLDITSTENSKPNSTFKEFYDLANSKGMITKVHTGEQLGADYIVECIKNLNPKQIQHGIHIVEDEKAMALAKEREIVFNVCPTSNIILGYAKSIKDHPIKKMVEYGLKVTIATDDLLFFDSDINEEYLKLYQAGTLSLEQLDEIREFGLSLCKNNRSEGNE